MAVTIRDVAQEAGTTISTVSKAMNNSYTISGEMISHVKAVAGRLGYRPNSRAQSFARRACREVVFLTHLPVDIAFTNPHMFEIIAGAESALVSEGYALKLYGCDADTVCTLVKDIMERKLADGLLLHGSVVTKELDVLLTRMEVPHIVIGKPCFENSMCWIDNNNKLEGELATGYLLKKRHRVISFIGGLERDMISQDRLKGVKIRLKENDLTLDKAHIFLGESTVENGAKMAQSLIKSGGRPSAIICANNALAFGCLRTLQVSGIDVPKDISLITFDDYPLAKLTVPTLTTVSIDVYDMGVSAGKILINKVKRPQMQIQMFTTVPRVVTRDSTGSFAVRKTDL